SGSPTLCPLRIFKFKFHGGKMKGKLEIEETLRALIGMPLWASGRAGIQWFQFGARRVVPNIRLSKVVGTKEVGDYALHVACTWRIVGPNGIIVGSGDRNYSAGDDPYKELPDSEWDKPGANR